ncbi:MAG: hypothetical protein K5660_05440 [Paludibacteraceae bacterium]|nr:hypothetical protein [Paludibacteraceae bacterium]
MRILVAPLNWGLGHATRCIPIVNQLIAEGNEVVLAGDGISLRLLKKTFPTLRMIPLSPLELRYSEGKSQTWAIVRALPKIIRSALADHRLSEKIVRQERIDEIISDNRFGCHAKGVRNIYITHQLFVRLPRGWRWAEKFAHQLHRLIWNRYDEVWVPDYEEFSKSLSGALSHIAGHLPSEKIRYIGPLSRLKPSDRQDTRYEVVALLSGLEPQRTLLEQAIRQRYDGKNEQLLIIRGKYGEPEVKWHRGNQTIVPFLKDEPLVDILQGAKKIVCRSGYSTVMDLAALNILDKAEFIPTPGQTEQEYLADFLKKCNSPENLNSE